MADTLSASGLSIEALYAAFPWVRMLRIDQHLRQWLAEGLSGEALVNAARQTEQYQRMFPWIRRKDGTMRMSEVEYLLTQDRYRELHRQYGFREPSDPFEFGSYFEGEVSVDELKQRFDTYRSIERAGRSVREAFYVYAGMDVSVDDLYRAVTTPDGFEWLSSEYNRRVASQTLDYQTWIQRATDVGLARVTETLEQLKREGALTGTAVQRVRAVNREFAKQMMDVLYHGGSPEDRSQYLSSLDELVSAFEQAMIAGAATEAGFSIPDRERVQQLRAAGVERAKALEAYNRFAAQSGSIAAAVSRHAGRLFGVREWEEAVFLAGDAKGDLERSMAQEKGLGSQAGGFATGRDEDGRVRTFGMTTTMW